MTEFELGSTMMGCPIYWQNFISDLQHRFNCEDRDVPILKLRRELLRFNAVLSPAEDSVRFLSKRDLTFFILRWS